jgi:glyoxylase-like metal-dependent hydrolase (beta-lactamase superfamily II)
VFVEGNKVLFAGDTVMPVPYLPWGNWEEYRESLRRIRTLRADVVVQGHGEILLRGEMQESVDSSIAYLDTIHATVSALVDRGGSEEDVVKIDVESCGKSRIPLHGVVTQLHRDNMLHMYRLLRSQKTLAPAAV